MDMWNNLTEQFAIYSPEFIATDEINGKTEEAYSLPIWVTRALLVLYSAFVMIAVGGNIVVCVLILTKKNLRTVANYFVVSLAMSDILMVILCVPFTVLTNLIYYHWIFGSFLCPIVGYIQLSSVIQRAFVLVAAAADRHHAIWRPMNKRLSRKGFKILIVAIWVAALMIPLPVAMFSKVVSIRANTTAKLCLEMWPRTNERFAYGIGMMAITYAIPLTVLCFTYAHIVAIIGSKPPGEGEALRDKRRMTVKKKAIKTMVCVVMAYAICWLPIHVLTVAGDINPTIFDKQAVHVIWLFCHCLAMSNSASNPIIYFTTKTVYQQGLAEIIRRQTSVDILGSITARIRTSLSDDSRVYVGLKRRSCDILEFINARIRTSITNDNKIHFGLKRRSTEIFDLNNCVELNPVLTHFPAFQQKNTYV